MFGLKEISNEIPILSAHSKDSYDSDEILVNNMKIFEGDIASRYSNPQGEDDTLSGGSSVETREITEECAEGVFHANKNDSSNKPIVLKSLDEISLDSIWAALHLNIKG